MKLSYVQMHGFRGFCEPARINIPAGFAIIAGANGAGKSTVCDAVEFVITGGIRASSEHREKGESIHDYLWWRGPQRASDHYVEVGFVRPDGTIVTARRTPSTLTVTPDQNLNQLLLVEGPALENPLAQLCRTAILRDEEITRLSIDLRETDRFEFVTAALGGADFAAAELNAKRVADTLKRHHELAQREYERQRERVAQLTTHLSQLRVQSDKAAGVSEAEAVLKRFVPQASNEGDLMTRSEQTIALRRTRLDALKRQYTRLTDIFSRLAQTNTAEHQRAVSEATARLAEAEKEATAAAEEARSVSDTVSKAQSQSPRYLSLAQLLEHGRRLGLEDGRCPLCGTEQTEGRFSQHLAGIQTSLNKANADLAILSRRSAETGQRAVAADSRIQQLRAELSRLSGIEVATRSELTSAVTDLARLGVALDDNSETALRQLASNVEGLQKEVSEMEGALSVLIASQAANQIVDAERELLSAREQLVGTEKTLSVITRSEDQLREASQTIKRVQGELVDEQLAALSPLLVELYERLRPHVDWRLVRYVLRGDVRRMLSLEVGSGLNPNFVFSSGQRRAAGLAFLLAIFLSRSWCKLRTLVLDDPVQHVDDYRALHLIEVLAAIRRTGHQVICTVEDRALAELLARRLRSDFDDQGALIDMAYESGRGSRVAHSRSLTPLTQRLLVAS